MTPRGFDASVVHVRLHRMGEILDWLDDLGEVSEERLASDDLLRPAVLWQLVQLVELAVAVNGHLAVSLVGRAPIDYRESFGLVARVGAVPKNLAEELAPSTGLRNVLVHQYLEVDLGRVAASVAAARDGFGRYVGAVSQFLLEQEPEPSPHES